MAAEELAHVRIRRRMRAHDERLRREVKAHERVGVPLADPYDVRVVDENGIGHRAIAWQLPFLPRRAVVAGDLTRVPLAHPYPALRVAPHSTGTLTWCGRVENDGAASLALDPTDVTTGERRVVQTSIGADRDAVGPRAPRRVKDRHRAARWIESPVDAVLSGEPERAVAIEDRRVEVCVRTVGR